MAYGSFAPPAYPQPRRSPPPLPNHLRHHSGTHEAFREIPPTGIVIAADSVVAKKHPDNEDRFDMRGGMSLVADGVGAYGGGAVASEAVRKHIQPETLRTLAKNVHNPEARAELAQVYRFLTNTSFASIEEAEDLMRRTIYFLSTMVERTVATDPSVAVQAEARTAAHLNVATLDPNNKLHQRLKQAVIQSNSTTTILGRTWTLDGHVLQTIGSVGDGGGYLIRGSEIKKLTLDQSPISALIATKARNTKGEPLTADSVEQDLNQRVRVSELLRAAASGHDRELKNVINEFIKQWSERGEYPDTLKVHQACIERGLPPQRLYAFMQRALEGDESRVRQRATFTLREINNAIASALGAEQIMKRAGLELNPHITTVEVFAGDAMIKVSDGISNNVPGKKMLKIWNACKGDVESFKNSVITEARRVVKEGGGKDDDMTITVEYFTTKEE